MSDNKNKVHSYKRIMYRVDEPEVFKPITEDVVPDVLPRYEISNYGNIRDIELNKTMNLYHNTHNGYNSISLRKNDGNTVRRDIHRLELMVFNPHIDPTNLQVNHNNGTKIDNYLYNLEWNTSSDNLKHSYENRLAKVGEDNVLSTHTNAQVHEICRLLEQRVAGGDICKAVGMEPNTTNIKFVAQIRRGEIWVHISKQYNIPKEGTNQLFSDEHVHQICRFILDGYSNLDIYSLLNIEGLEKEKGLNTIRMIRNKKRLTRISDNYF